MPSKPPKKHQLREIHLLVKNFEDLEKLKKGLNEWIKNNKKSFPRVEFSLDLTGANLCLRLIRSNGFPGDYKKPILNEARSILGKKPNHVSSDDGIAVYSFC